MTAKHHPFSPSVFFRRAECPASLQMEEQAAEIPTDEAEEGTRLHREVAEALRQRRFEDEDELVQKCLDLVKTLTRGEEWFELVIEDPLELVLQPGKEPETGGTPDLVIVLRSRIYVIDWKFGYVPINPGVAFCQVGLYAMMVLRKWTDMPLVAHVFQPRTGMHFSAAFNKADFSRFEGILVNTRGKATGDDWFNHFNPSPVVCEYCKARYRCPAVRARLPKLYHTKEAGEALSPLQIARVLKWRGIIRDLLQEAEMEARRLLKAGVEVPGWRLETHAGDREVTDVAGLARVVAPYVPADELLAMVKLPVTKVEDATIEKMVQIEKKKGQKLTKKAAKEVFARISSAFIGRKRDEEHLKESN